MMISVNTSQKGFSLIELMVTMAIASVLMAGIYKFYHHQLRTHVTQQEMVDMQQDARAAMYMMTREIRMAGYDPQYNTGATIRTANVAAIAFDSDDNILLRVFSLLYAATTIGIFIAVFLLA